MMRCLLLMTVICPAVAASQESADAQAIEQEVMKVLDQYMVTFNQMDVAAWEKTFHFPHYRLASGNMTALNATGEQDEARMKERFKSMGWHHSAWQRRKIVHLSDTKAHVDTEFTRYRADGTVVASFDSLYILIKESGRWGIKMRSSFAQ